jgi:hypothetical protein
MVAPVVMTSSTSTRARPGTGLEVNAERTFARRSALLSPRWGRRWSGPRSSALASMPHARPSASASSRGGCIAPHRLAQRICGHPGDEVGIGPLHDQHDQRSARCCQRAQATVFEGVDEIARRPGVLERRHRPVIAEPSPATRGAGRHRPVAGRAATVAAVAGDQRQGAHATPAEQRPRCAAQRAAGRRQEVERAGNRHRPTLRDEP